MSVFSAVLLAVGSGLIVPAAAVLSAYLLFGVGRGVETPAPDDPNEAARAVGSWG
jgi:hypothetical protein